MATPAERFAALSVEVETATREFIVNHCKTNFDPLNPPGSPVCIITGEGDYHLELRGEGATEKQASLVAKFDRLSGMAEWLVRDAGNQIRLVDIRANLAQLGRVYDADLEAVAERICSNVRGWTILVDMSLDDWSNETLYVPDTNALIRNPNLEDWMFPDSPRFTVLLLPTVLQELDLLKSPAKSDSVRKQAEGVIRRIKGWRSRGRLSDGVTILNHKIFLRSVATEPAFSRAPSRLGKDRRDDRIIATLLDIMREHPKSDITFVTNDINLQNRADHLEIQFSETPTPKANQSK